MLKYFFEFFFPKTCFGCNSILPKTESYLCLKCRDNLPITDFHISKENEINRLFFGKINVFHAMSFLYFTKNGIVQNIIHNLKYKGNKDIGIFLANIYGDILSEQKRDIKNIDIIIPVPLHKKKLLERGYNQVEEFAKTLAGIINIEYRNDILERIINQKSQTKKDKEKRYNSISNSFKVRKDKEHLLKDKHILIVDDVITTGATLEICCKEVLKYDIKEVSVLSIAKATF